PPGQRTAGGGRRGDRSAPATGGQAGRRLPGLAGVRRARGSFRGLSRGDRRPRNGRMRCTEAPPVPEKDPRVGLLLALADDELILGHRHSEWTGWAPNIEEDLAFSSIAQDEMAHARLLYRLASELTGKVGDSLALVRQPVDYVNDVLCE